MGSYQGACHCGAVTFSLEGPPNYAVYCHCSVCRRSTGAPFVMAGSWSPEALTMGEGATTASRATSSYLTRVRCAECGAALYNQIRSGKMQAENVMLPLLEDRAGIEPTHHIYYADRVMDVADELPKFDAFGIPKKG